MNERIKELIEQSGFEEQDGHISIKGVYMFNTHRMEKFAELIVRECISIMEHAHDNKMRLSDAIWNTRIGFDIE